MKYTDLIFDLYGTLVDIHTEENDAVWEKTALYFSFHGAHYTGPQLREAFGAAMRRQEAQAGRSYECYPDIPFENVMAQLLEDRGVENAEALGFSAAQLFRILSIEHLRLYPHVEESLTALRQRGFRLWLLSNAQRAFTAYELRHLGLEKYFDGVYLSSDYRCRKPDGRFFRVLVEERKLDPAACLMIGNDLDTDIAGASGAGMDTLYMHTALTPPEQRPASPALYPGKSPKELHHYEFEGDDWNELTELICQL